LSHADTRGGPPGENLSAADVTQMQARTVVWAPLMRPPPWGWSDSARPIYALELPESGVSTDGKREWHAV